MPRYINADLIEYKPMCRARGNGMYEDCEIAYKNEIDDIPTADVRENARGEWIDTEPDKDIFSKSNSPYKCSNCGKHAGKNKVMTYKFCPWCGADMRGEEGEEE